MKKDKLIKNVSKKRFDKFADKLQVKRHNNNIKANTLSKDDYKRKIQLNTLQKEYLSAGIDMVKYVSDSEDWLNANRSNEKLDPKMRIMNDMLQRRMLVMALNPLIQGVTKKSVLMTVATFAGMYAANPNFRKQFTKSKAAACDTLAKLYDKQAGKDTEVGYKLRSRRDKYLARVHDGRVPYTAETAAMQYLSFVRQAYYKSRQDGVNLKDVKAEFDKVTEALDNMMQVDGIDRSEFEKQQHIMAYHYAQSDLEGSIIFADILNYDKSGVYQVKDQVYTKDGIEYNETFDVWDGSMVDSHGDKVSNIQPNYSKMTEKEYIHKTVDLVLNDKGIGPEYVDSVITNAFSHSFDKGRFDYESDDISSKLKKLTVTLSHDLGLYSNNTDDFKKDKFNCLMGSMMTANTIAVTSVCLDEYKKGMLLSGYSKNDIQNSLMFMQAAVNSNYDLQKDKDLKAYMELFEQTMGDTFKSSQDTSMFLNMSKAVIGTHHVINKGFGKSDDLHGLLNKKMLSDFDRHNHFILKFDDTFSVDGLSAIESRFNHINYYDEKNTSFTMRDVEPEEEDVFDADYLEL